MRSKEWALKFRLSFGKHKGKTLAELYVDQSDYLRWLLDQIDGAKYGDLFEALQILVGEEV